MAHFAPFNSAGRLSMAKSPRAEVNGCAVVAYAMRKPSGLRSNVRRLSMVTPVDSGEPPALPIRMISDFLCEFLPPI